MQEAVFQIHRLENNIDDLTDERMRNDLLADQHSSQGKADVEALSRDFLIDKTIRKALDVAHHRDARYIVSRVRELRNMARRKHNLEIEPSKNAEPEPQKEEVVELNERGRPKRHVKVS